MGWLFVALGLLTIAGGTFLVNYGQNLVRHPHPASAESHEIVLNPEQERLLGLLADYQKQFAATKLIVGRKTGVLHFDGEPERGQGISLISDLHGEAQTEARVSDFERLMESLPLQFVRSYGESRFDNPFVVSVTREGTKYLRE